MVAVSSDNCEDEWTHARQYCMEMFALNDPPRGVTGKTMDQCMRGQVSERCGGNLVEGRR